ncbi:sulfatase-like hydrolase/transferase [Vibrio sp. JC009]|uniref:sulfatase-like hydrolase/transferase n=1 Tax=Vibrio sp. JC009 TaxID=2912314 RepID=UPI0023AEC676|nr:sulfatase-like hydrolase/transferase [Vibrio sp. JC009]WED24699.1 sulfatase-like hydrolase/transferase [Vibrio sp. JC009]
MKLSSAISTACLTALPCMAMANEAPNVLLIIADDMGIDASSCYSLGDQQANMPNLEALCEQSMVFENGYSAPVCSPTRATIMTGQYGFRTGVGAAIPPRGTNGLSADANSLFDLLDKTDYSANLLGKWHLAGAGESLNHPEQLGVPDYFGMFKGGVRDYFTWPAVTHGSRVKVNNYSTTEITDKALNWMDEQKNPWFLWLAYNAPHTPFHLPPADLHTAGDLPSDADSIKRNPLPYYNAMLEALDSEIGRLLTSMDKKTRDNTVIMFVGDNGTPNQVTRGFYGDHAAKGTIYDSGTHVPFIVNGPGVKPGRTDAFVSTSDLFATVAGYAGVKVDSSDSFDFRPALSGGKGERDYVYVEHFQEDKSDSKPSDVFGWAIREGQYKLIQIEGEESKLYDLSVDPREANNLLADGISDSEKKIITDIRARYEMIRNS